MSNYNNQDLSITLSELTESEFRSKVNVSRIRNLVVNKDQSKLSWTSLPPLSWYQKRPIVPPYNDIPEIIWDMSNIRKLSLINLDINIIPDEILKLHKLEELNISMNKIDITSHLEVLGKLKKLKKINILGNKYDNSFIADFDEQHPELEVIYLIESYERD